MARDVVDSIRIIQGETLTSLVADRLEQKVISGALGAGERLNEVALASEFGVSRGPVRESIRILERKGLVTVIANRGAFVSRIDHDDMIDLYRLRAVITGLACQLAAERADPDITVALSAFLARMDEATRADDREGYYALNLAFHDCLVAASGSVRVGELNRQLVNQAHLFRRGSLAQATDMRRSNDEHGAIVAAIAKGDPALARQLGEAHVNAGRSRFEALLPRAASDV